MTPDLAGGLIAPSYFSLSRESTINKDSRRTSGRSDQGNSDSLNQIFSSFLNDPLTQQMINLRRSPIEEISPNEGNDRLTYYRLRRPVDGGLGAEEYTATIEYDATSHGSIRPDDTIDDS